MTVGVKTWVYARTPCSERAVWRPLLESAAVGYTAEDAGDQVGIVDEADPDEGLVFL